MMTQPVRPTVLVDTWHLAGFSADRGIGTYLRSILPALVEQGDLTVAALAPSTCDVPDGVERHSIGRHAPNRFAQREHDTLLPLSLARAFRRSGADVVLSPADNPPAWSPRPWVQVLHDLIPLTVPDRAYVNEARRWRRLAPRLRRAAAIVAVSRSTAADAVREVGVDPERIHVAYNGVSPAFRPPASAIQDGPPTLLSVGQYGPHKGFREAFAVAGEIAETGLLHRLAMVGYLAPWYEPIVRDLLHAAPRPDRVDLLGHVDDLVARYQRADVLIVTSRYEGFCLPALEAMACGTPVVAFSNSALPEVVGEAGILVPDGDVAAMVSAVRSLLTDRARRDEHVARGIEHARTFTWERSAAVHSEVLRHAASNT